jgi:hypothetical protein
MAGPLFQSALSSLIGCRPTVKRPRTFQDLAGNPFGTFWAPFEVRMRTHESRWCLMGIDFSGESQQDGSGIERLHAFTRQGSQRDVIRGGSNGGVGEVHKGKSREKFCFEMRPRNPMRSRSVVTSESGLVNNLLTFLRTDRARQG